MYIAISTRYKSIQSKNIAFYSKKRDFLILAKVSKKTENIFLRKFLKFCFINKKDVTGECSDRFSGRFYHLGGRMGLNRWIFYAKNGKNVCVTKCAKLPVYNA